MGKFLSHDFSSNIKPECILFSSVTTSSHMHVGIMEKLWKTVVKIILAVLPVICIVLLSVSIVMLAVSLDPGVKWNEYHQKLFPNSNFFGYYFSTLWSSLDVTAFAGEKNGLPCTGKYMLLLKPLRDESWRVPIRTTLHQAIGLVSGTLFLLIVSLTINNVTKQKLFCTITKVAALGTGITGGYFTLKAISDYVIGIPDALSLIARSLNDPDNRYYYPEKEEMQVGYNLAKYSAVTTIIGCALILGNIGLYIPFGEGKWIWQKKTEVIPDTERRSENFTNFTETNKPGQPVKNKGGIVSVKEFVPE
ncbi:unnamed protein product [Mytilus coruscus]|uniref:Uncharacterized protein n=1 Tax=Mytilus coruscus TaxID=42192 RepID=A0A6J8CJL1_MYTCO|nr:unnamed protein product [Mytilus coruscus]